MTENLVQCQRDRVAALFAMVRQPLAGTTKTRLAASIGPDKATELYRLCAGLVFRTMRELPGSIRKYLFLDTVTVHLSAGWIDPGFVTRQQVGNNLGERLTNAFTTVLEEGATSAIAIASDTPDISVHTIGKALLALETSDVVIGPSHDGGYYLIGMNRLHPQIFQDISWSTPSVTSETILKATALGIQVRLLTKLIDIDTLSDLKAWLSSPGYKDPQLAGFARTLTRTTETFPTGPQSSSI